MDERDVIVRADHIPQCRQPLLNPLDLDFVRYAVAEMLQFLVGGGGGDEQTFAVAGRQAPDDARAGDGAVGDGNDVLEFGFEDGVEGFAGAERDKAVRVAK